ncbi:hypothetical protein BDQ17DRAFT_1336822 [Cyathus striatus]|nr:hypothetical protein BDQ17DRAFT_1336822 [Cyathus striatus]
MRNPKSSCVLKCSNARCLVQLGTHESLTLVLLAQQPGHHMVAVEMTDEEILGWIVVVLEEDRVICDGARSMSYDILIRSTALPTDDHVSTRVHHSEGFPATSSLMPNARSCLSRVVWKVVNRGIIPACYTDDYQGCCVVDYVHAGLPTNSNHEPCYDVQVSATLPSATIAAHLTRIGWSVTFRVRRRLSFIMSICTKLFKPAKGTVTDSSQECMRARLAGSYERESSDGLPEVWASMSMALMDLRARPSLMYNLHEQLPGIRKCSLPDAGFTSGFDAPPGVVQDLTCRTPSLSPTFDLTPGVHGEQNQTVVMLRNSRQQLAIDFSLSGTMHEVYQAGFQRKENGKKVLELIYDASHGNTIQIVLPNVQTAVKVVSLPTENMVEKKIWRSMKSLGSQFLLSLRICWCSQTLTKQTSK